MLVEELCTEEKDKQRFKELNKYFIRIEISDLTSEHVLEHLPNDVEQKDRILMRVFLNIIVLPYLETYYRGSKVYSKPVMIKNKLIASNCKDISEFYNFKCKETLKTIDLSSNKIDDNELLNVFNKCKELKDYNYIDSECILLLQDNKITKTTQENIGIVKQLCELFKIVDIRGNPITVNIETLSKMSNLIFFPLFYFEQIKKKLQLNDDICNFHEQYYSSLQF
jgi:hypothetical protein